MGVLWPLRMACGEGDVAACVGAAAEGAGALPACTTCAVSSAVARAASVWVEPGAADGDAELDLWYVGSADTLVGDVRRFVGRE